MILLRNIQEEQNINSLTNNRCCRNVLIISTAKKNVILPNFLVWKFCGKVQFPHIFRQIAQNYANYCTFPQNFHTKKLGENMVFFAVIWFNLQNYLISITSVPIICQDNNNKTFFNIFKKSKIIKKIVNYRCSESIEKTHSLFIRQHRVYKYHQKCS